MTVTPTPTRTESHLRLRAERVGERTRLTELECRAPLQLLRCHYLDPLQPGMAHATIVSASGGVLQGDRMQISALVEGGAKLHLDTPSATRLYRMPDGHAAQEVTLSVRDDGYLAYLPEPAIPYAGSDFRAHTRCEVDEQATLIFAEVVSAGRAARGEIHQFARYESVVEIARPGGPALAIDVTRLDPADGLTAPGRLGRHGSTGTLYVIHAGFTADQLRVVAVGDGIVAGASALPGGLGAWVKVLGPDGPSVAAFLGHAAAAAHRDILGTEPPRSRRP